MKRISTGIALAAFSMLIGLVVTGCGDDVKTEKRMEVHEESEPQMVSPGEYVVE